MHIATFGHCDLRKSVASIGGLLTLPILQANTLRLEALAHLAIANCRGRWCPTRHHASCWFKMVGKCVSHLEDPTEDVFTTRVIFNGTNYCILEGLYEANGHHLQHILHAVEGMPNRGVFADAKQDCEVLLVLSELLCTRAGLHAFLEGSKCPLKSLPIKSMPTMKQLAARTTFSYRDLKAAGCDVQWLSRFILPPNEQGVTWSPNVQSPLYRKPLLDTGAEIIVAVPSALGAAIREAVIEMCIQTDNQLPLRAGVLQSQIEALRQNPMIRDAHIPFEAINLKKILESSPPVEIEPGYWVHFVLLLDDLEGFEEGGISGINSSGSIAEPEIQAEIEQSSAHCRAQPGFKAGLAFIVTCGFGRVTPLVFNGSKDWFVVGASDYDVDVIGWLHNFDFSELIKLSAMEWKLRSMGYTLNSLNGLLVKVGIVQANEGHLIQQDAMPDSFNADMIYMPTYAHLELRVAHHRRWDVRSIAAPDDRTVVVRRNSYSEPSHNAISRIYYDLEDIKRGIFRGAWHCGSRTWWVHALIEGNTNKSFHQCVLDMQCVWIDRIAKTLCNVLPSLPDLLVWRLNIAPWLETRAAKVIPATPEEIASDVSSSIDPKFDAIVTGVGPAFYRGLDRSDNAAEAELVRSFVEQAVALSGQKNQSVEALMDEIVPSPDARQIHVFAAQDFRDRERDAIGSCTVLISPLDDATVRIGLGWHGIDRPGGTLHGKNECTEVLNKITSTLEQEFCQELSKFERRALVMAAIANHENAAIDTSTWYRISKVHFGLAEDKTAYLDKITEHLAKLNFVFLTSRILIEAGLCECPFGEGKIPADIDLSRLMAMAVRIFYLGGYSDAIRYGCMKDTVRISPAGEVLIDTTFEGSILELLGRSIAEQLIDMHSDHNSDLIRKHNGENRSSKKIVEDDFMEAWKAEIGTSLADCKRAVMALEKKLVAAGAGWEIVPRRELIAFLNDHIKDPEAYVAAFETVPRDGWKHIPTSFVDHDRQPWRFQRRLSVYRRPLLRLYNSNDVPVLVAPGILRDSLLMMIQNFYNAETDQKLLTSGKMRQWWNFAQDRDAKEFEVKVCDELKKLGWSAMFRMKFSEILGVGLQEDVGDIDVLAWRPDGRIIVIECKKLKLAKTPSEVAKQLSKYQGVMDEKGRPDMLAKHLKRLTLARRHVAAFQKYTGVQTPSIEGALVFSRIVPMTFAKHKIEEDKRCLTFDHLSKL